MRSRLAQVGLIVAGLLIALYPFTLGASPDVDCRGVPMGPGQTCAKADGSAMASYALSEREAGSDAAAMRTRARADGDDWILNGTKCWITNGGKSSWYTVMAVTDPDKGANGISA